MDLIAELTNHTIYFVNSENVKYYIALPKNFKSTNITIEFKEDVNKYDSTANDATWVKENVINLYKEIDNYNITLMIPILKEEEIKLLLSPNPSDFVNFERIISLYINGAFNNINVKGIKVDNTIYLIKSEKYNGFINYFASRHGERVNIKTMLELIAVFSNQSSVVEEFPKIDNSNLSNQESPTNNNFQNSDQLVDENIKKNYKTITSGGINFVVGKTEEQEKLEALEAAQKAEVNATIQTGATIDNNPDKNVKTSKLKVEIPSNIVVGDGQLPKNAGFASYFVIFSVSALAIFLVLYIIIK